jgi:hypothetical protein
MVDFLSRLVERSMGAASIARPAMAPIFAPGPAIAAEPVSEEPGAVGVLPRSPAPATAPIQRAPTPVLPGASVMGFSRPNRVPPPALPAAPAHPPGEGMAVGLRAVPADSRGPGRVPTLAIPVVPPTTPEETAPGALRPAATAPPQAPRGGADHGDRPPRPKEVPVRASLTPSVEQGPSTVPRRLPVREERQSGDAEVRSVATPLLRPREERASRWAADLKPHKPEGTPSPPIVRVSIGRIEVRAVPPAVPAAPRPTPARTSAALSLEEYLRPRSRGR